MEEEDELISFDVSKIKVTVTSSMDIDRFPVVRIKRLSQLDISKYTQLKENITSESADSSITKHNLKNKTTHIKQNKAAYIKQNNENTYLTRSKTKGSVGNLKRKSDLILTEMKNSKKQKKTDDELPISEMKPSEKQKISEASQLDEKQNSKTKECNIVANLLYSIDEVVWGKIRGWPHWPARVTSIEQNKYVVTWFNDYRKSKLFHTQLFKFYPNFESFSNKFSSSIGLETAAKEALLYIGHSKK